jgi:cytochrome b
MSQEKNPVFRKAIIPWYDSSRTCWIVVGFLLAVVLFGGAGVDEAFNTPPFAGYFWVPLLLILLGLGVIGSILIRLLRRYLDRLSR